MSSDTSTASPSAEIGPHLEPAEVVAMLSTSTADLSSRIRRVEKVWKNAANRIEGRFFYPAFRNGKPSVAELVEIAHLRMVNFAIPRARIAEVTREIVANPQRADLWVQLATEARDLFIKTKEKTAGRSGELGELLLYMLLEWVLAAPIVASKMYLKTSLDMPVHGTDGIHIGHSSGKLVLYWGESKLHAKRSSALASICESVADFVKSAEKRTNEVRIIQSNLRDELLRPDQLEAFRNYFNPYKEESNKVVDCHACLAGFDSQLYAKVAEDPVLDSREERLRALIEADVEALGLEIEEKAKAAGLQDVRFAYFILPFPSIEEARKAFQVRLWGRDP